MKPIRSIVALFLTVGIGVAASGQEAAPPVALPKDPPRTAGPAVPGEVRLGEPAPLPARAPGAAPKRELVPAAPVRVPVPAVRAQARPVEMRAGLQANVVIFQAGAFVPRKVIVDANGVQRIVPGDFDQWVFGVSGPNGAETRRRTLATQLQQRINAIDAVCILTATQRTRLELVGRGDITRLFDSIALVKRDVEAAKEDYDRIEELYQANAALRVSVVNGPFGEDSLLFKSIEPLLNPTQKARFESFRELLRDPTRLICSETGLIDVNLRGVSFHDAGLSRLTELGTPERPLRLRNLYLYQAQVTDAELASLPASESLESLSFYQTPIGDAGLVDLGRFSNLRRLNLSGLAFTNGSLTNESLKEIGKLTRLTSLNIANAQVSDEGIAQLRNLTELMSLSLQGNPIGDDALAHLEKLTRLQSLMISQTNVTDAGIAKLRGMQQLRTLYVRNSKVTPEGIAELKKTLPNLSTDIQ